MTDILEILIFIIAAFILYRLIFYIVKRLAAMRKISALKEMCGASVTYSRPPFLTFFKLRDKADVVVETRDSIYLVRFIDTPGGVVHLHFASDRFFVTYVHSVIPIGGLLQMRKRYRAAARNARSSTSCERVRILPPMKVEEKYTRAKELYGKNLVPVLLFNPAPRELSYVTEAKTSIKVAFTGDEVYGSKVFTASTFAIHVDRMTREAKNKDFL